MITTNITVRDFVDGVPLTYVNHKKERCEVAYRLGDGLYVLVDEVEQKPHITCDDVGARRVFWNLTGGKKDDES